MGLDIDADAQDAGLIAAAQKVKRYEIALYGTLCAFAKQLGPRTPRASSTRDSKKKSDRRIAHPTGRAGHQPERQGVTRQQPAGHAVRNRRRSGRRAAPPGRGGLPTHLYGREGGRLGGPPRHAKAVEINALWYNALRLLEGWVREEDGAPAAEALAACAAKCRASFNQRFWFEPGGHLFDVLDGPDGQNAPALRPNQVFAVSLDHPVLDRVRWASVLGVVREKLLTPVGLRSLATGEKDYKPRYFGDLRSRDAASHQGTVWGWLIGPFVDAWMKAHPEDRAGAAALLAGFRRHMGEACVGSISEVFDAEAPYTPRGCIAQAWSVAEVLRCLVKTAGQGVSARDLHFSSRRVHPGSRT